MKLSNDTLSVLKNFGNINQGIFFKKGKVLKTVSSRKNILAEAAITEDIPQNFGVYNVNELLSVLSLYKDVPTFQFNDKYADIVDGKGKAKTEYRFCEASLLTLPPDKQLEMPNPEISFELTVEDFDWIMRSASVLGSPQIAVDSDGDKVFIKTLDTSNDAAHINTLEIANGNGNKYRMIFKTENITKIMAGSYDVKISSKGISHFKNKKVPLQYWITTETGSKFEKA